MTFHQKADNNRADKITLRAPGAPEVVIKKIVCHLTLPVFDLPKKAANNALIL